MQPFAKVSWTCGYILWNQYTYHLQICGEQGQSDSADVFQGGSHWFHFFAFRTDRDRLWGVLRNLQPAYYWELAKTQIPALYRTRRFSRCMETGKAGFAELQSGDRCAAIDVYQRFIVAVCVPAPQCTVHWWRSFQKLSLTATNRLSCRRAYPRQ